MNDLLAWNFTEQPVANNTNYAEDREQETDEKVELLRSKIRTKESYKNVSSAEMTKIIIPDSRNKKQLRDQ